MKPQIETKDEKVIITLNRLDSVRLRDIVHHYGMGLSQDIGARTFAMQLRDELNESIDIACSQRMKKKI